MTSNQTVNSLRAETVSCSSFKRPWYAAQRKRFHKHLLTDGCGLSSRWPCLPVPCHLPGPALPTGAPCTCRRAAAFAVVLKRDPVDAADLCLAGGHHVSLTRSPSPSEHSLCECQEMTPNPWSVSPGPAAGWCGPVNNNT